MLNRTNVFIVVVFALLGEVHAQTWQPAVRLWGATMNNVVVQVPNGPPLIPLWNGPNAPKDSVWLYSIPTLSLNSQPYEKQLPLLSFISTFEVNGNGFYEVSGTPKDGVNRLILDAFTPLQRARTMMMSEGPRIRIEERTSILDCDEDNVNDVFWPPIYAGDDDFSHVVYGDATEPFVKESIVRTRENKVSGKWDDVIALGRLSGKVCMVKLVWFKPTPSSDPKAKYVLEELDAEDLRIRRDTIRTRVLQEIVPEKRSAYSSPVILCDSVWWVGSPNDELPLILRFSIDGAQEVPPDPSWSKVPGYTLSSDLLFGQHKISGQNPVVIDGSQPFLFYHRTIIVGDSITRSVVLFKVTDQNRLAVEEIGEAHLPNGSIQRGGVESMTLCPDIDEDGIQDFVVHHTAIDSVSNQVRDAVDVFLTTGRVISHVNDASPAYKSVTVTRTNDGWTVADTSFCKATTQKVLLYSVEGKLVAFADVRIIEGGLMIVDPHATFTGPLFAVVGNCPIRLQ